MKIKPTNDLQYNLRVYMAKKSATYRSLSRDSGLNQTSIARILTGSTIPRATTLIRLAEALDVTPRDLLRPAPENALAPAPVASDDPQETMNKITESVFGSDHKDLRNKIPLVAFEDLYAFLKVTLKHEPTEHISAPPISDDNAESRGLIATRMNSCAMDPVIKDGELLYLDIYDKQDYRSGDLVVGETGGELLIGELVRDPQGHLLISFAQEKFGSVEVERIVARVIGKFTLFSLPRHSD